MHAPRRLPDATAAGSARAHGPRPARDRDLVAEIATDAYVYLYPLVLMDITRRQATNVVAPEELPGRAPMNAFAHLRSFPSPEYHDVVRPNFDTLYSFAWVDVTREPVVVSVPDAGDRYYLLPMYDMWSDVFASPGTRTTGNGSRDFVLVGRRWRNAVPRDLVRIEAPTPHVWILGRTQCDGTGDYAYVNAFQEGLRVTPLSAWDGPAEPVVGRHDLTLDTTTPAHQQVERLTPAAFFTYASELLKLHPPHTHDYPIVHRLERIGLVVGERFDVRRARRIVREALPLAVADARLRLWERTKYVGWQRNRWLMNTETMGAWGTDYVKRATIDRMGLSANAPEDALYPLTFVDATGKALDGAHRYRLRFERDQLPPARAFWSLTLYDEDGFVRRNELGRYSLRDREVDRGRGPVEIAIQREHPGADLFDRWLPAPPGRFNLCLRLYWAKPEALDRTWAPPPVVRLD